MRGTAGRDAAAPLSSGPPEQKEDVCNRVRAEFVPASNRPLLRYLSPRSGSIVTMFPLPTSRASLSVAASAAPDDCPARIPSLKARRRHISNASSSLTLYTMSISDVSMVLAMKSLPIPSILYSPFFPPPIIEPSGSASTPFIPGFLLFRYPTTPVNVPPLPAPITA